MASLEEYSAVPGIMLVKCPFCEAEPGIRCKPKNGIPGNRNNSPHHARIKLAKQREGEK